MPKLEKKFDKSFKNRPWKKDSFPKGNGEIEGRLSVETQLNPQTLKYERET